MTGREASTLLGISQTAFNYTVHLLGIKSSGGFTEEQIKQVEEFRALPPDDPRKKAVYDKYKGREEKRKTSAVPITTFTGQYLMEKYNLPPGSIVRKDYLKEYNRYYMRERKFKPKTYEEFKATCLDEAVKEAREARHAVIEQAKRKTCAQAKNIANPLTEYIQFDSTFVFGDELKDEYENLRSSWGGFQNLKEKNDAKFQATAMILCKYHYWDRDDYNAARDHRLLLQANQSKTK